MKQILQNLRTGLTEVADVPRPAESPGHLLIRTTTTLVSAGTERMLVAFGQASLLGKARAQPERVRQVLDKVRTDGVGPTLDSVLNKLDQPLPLGYCNVGRVIGVGAGVDGFSLGDRVVSNGRHAEVVSVPKNLCARIPPEVSDEAAVFTVIGAIGLEGIRLLEPTLGESVVVMGLGLIGLVTAQLLRANGCRVLGVDLDPSRLALARSLGFAAVDLAAGEDSVSAAHAFSRGRGVDGVIIAVSTESNDPIHQAAAMCRQRGRIVLVGTTGLELARTDFYQKELSFQVSCSYGPGRYDPWYEDRGVDYPVGFVRWTEQRNFEAFLDMLHGGNVATAPLITHRFPIASAAAAYQVVTAAKDALGIVLTYPDEPRPSAGPLDRTVVIAPGSDAPIGLGFVGAGNYAGAVLVPAFKAAGARLTVIASKAGVTGLHVARKFGFHATTTDTDVLFANEAVMAVVIATRHDSHADLTVAALNAGKHVFVEKPLALTATEVDAVEACAARHPDRLLMVGFNRRFAPHVVKIKALLATVRQPAAFVMTVNAGAVPPGHWTEDLQQGGGRIVGEACHFIDLLRHLAGSAIVGHQATPLSTVAGAGPATGGAAITLQFASGSFGTVHYLTNGHRGVPKERLEVFVEGRVLQLDNFRRLRAFGWPGFRGDRLWRQDKGHQAAAAAFLDAIATGGPPPIARSELFEVARVTVAIAASLR